MKSFKPFDLSQSGLPKDVVEKIQICLSGYPEIETAVLYGSRAKGTFRTGSDIDLCLLGKGLTTSTILQLDNSLDDLMLPYSFDLSIYDKIDNPDFREHVNRVGRIFYQKASPEKTK